MKTTLRFFSLMIILAIAGFQVQTAHAWCTPRILQCGDVIDSSTVRGHDDIYRYSCTGSTNWNGKAHVYRINHGGDSLWIRLNWQGDSQHALGVFVLTSCNQNACIAYNAHNLNLRLPSGQYWIIVDSRTDAGTSYELSVFCGDDRLPVELLSFTGADASDGVHLAWSTASETDNSRFRVERQIQDSEEWDFIGQVSGQGQSTSETSYSFVDQTAQDGMMYAYRLISEDINGGTHELQLITVAHGTPAAQVPAGFRLLGNYPNPFNPSTRIAFDLSEQSHITLNVFDVSGRTVATLASGVFDAGAHEVNFDGTGLPSGVYFAQLVGAQQPQLIKMVLLK
ncbi:MAG TPA: T9SS type A sorting domain-containing protein [bacterium]|jgi:hypothetical protein